MLVKLSKDGNYSQKYDMYMCSVLHFHRCDMRAEVPARKELLNSAFVVMWDGTFHNFSNKYLHERKIKTLIDK